MLYNKGWYSSFSPALTSIKREREIEREREERERERERMSTSWSDK